MYNKIIIEKAPIEEAIDEAFKLTPTQFKIWAYFSKSREDMVLAQMTEIAAQIGISKRTFDYTIDEMTRLGYFVENGSEQMVIKHRHLDVPIYKFNVRLL